MADLDDQILAQNISLETVYNIPVEVSVILGRARIPIQKLVTLTSGDILELDKKVGDAVEIFANNKLIARGEIVTVESNIGVSLTEIIRDDI